MCSYADSGVLPLGFEAGCGRDCRLGEPSLAPARVDRIVRATDAPRVVPHQAHPGDSWVAVEAVLVIAPETWIQRAARRVKRREHARAVHPYLVPAVGG